MAENRRSDREIRFLMRFIVAIVEFLSFVVILPFVWTAASPVIYFMTWRYFEYIMCHMRLESHKCTNILSLDIVHCFKKKTIDEFSVAREEGRFHECILHFYLPFYTCLTLYIVYIVAYVIFKLRGKYHKIFYWMEYPLHATVWLDCYSAVKLLLWSEAWDVNSSYPKHDVQKLLCYVNCNNPQMVRLLLYKGADIRKTDANLMYRAVNTSNLETLHRLINAGIDNINVHNTMQAAVILGKINVVKYLVGRPGADVDSPFGPYCPLHLAVKYQRLDIAKVLLKAGANTRIPGFNGNTPAHAAVLLPNVKLAHILINSMGSIDRLNWEGNTVLHLAVRAKNKIITKLLIDLGAEINARDLEHHTPLHMACRDSDPDMVKIIKLLVDKGAQIDNMALRRVTPFHLAAQYQKLSTIRILLAKGANANIVTSKRETILHFAAANQVDQEVLKLFISMGFDTNVETTNADNLITYAAQNGAFNNYLLLLRNTIRTLDNEGETFLVFKSLLATAVKTMRFEFYIEPVYEHCEDKLMDKAEENLLKMADSKDSRIARTAIKYMALADHRNKDYIKIAYYYEIEYHPFMKKFYNICMKEILELERLELLDIVFVLITSKDQELLRYSEQEDMWQRVWEHRDKFPIYHKLLKEVFYPLVRKQAQREQAEMFICQILNLPDGTHLVAEKILSYLKPSDLSNLDSPV